MCLQFVFCKSQEIRKKIRLLFLPKSQIFENRSFLNEIEIPIIPIHIEKIPKDQVRFEIAIPVRKLCSEPAFPIPYHTDR